MISALAVLLLAYLPGAVLFRLPLGSRESRAALPAEERLFWAIVVSLIVSSIAALALAAGGWYTFERVLWIDAGIALLPAAIVRSRLRLGASTAPLSATALLPVLLLTLGIWVIFRVPPAEYIMGGRDPGIYMTEGIRIAQRGGVVVDDEVVSAVPRAYRDLFFPQTTQHGYYSSRFMGFYLLDPVTGAVVGQFPHLFPAWIALGYGVNGLSGARAIPQFAALLGLLAVYFAGARIVGRPAALAGSALLAVNVVQVWYARYPSAEMALQPLLFAGLLAFARTVRDGDPFFAPVAALLFVLGAFTHLTGTVAVVMVLAAAVLAVVVGYGRVRASFWVLSIAGLLLASVYLWRYIPPYFDVPLGFVQNLRAVHLALLAVGAVLAIAGMRLIRRWTPGQRDAWLGGGLTAVIWLLAIYAFFFRTAGGSLAPHDADSLRTFTSFYLTTAGLAAALAGFAVASRRFGDTSAFLLFVSTFSVLFFFKIRIVPEHFWMARRFLAVTLPGTLLLVGAAAFAPLAVLSAHRRGWLRPARYAAGAVLVLLIGVAYVQSMRPLLHHVEYAGLIPEIETLASAFGDEDLVLVESRGSSDAHVLALPLAYIYARNVLVFAEMAPPREAAHEFVTWAFTKYKRVFFMGTAGVENDLLSRSMAIAGPRGERFQVPEYESAPNAYPTQVKRKEFDLVFYELLPTPVRQEELDLDIGAADDPYVRGFHAKERSPAGFTYRWTRAESSVAIVGLRAAQREVTLWLGTGGRPANAPTAAVDVFLDDRPLGSVAVGYGIEPYRFAIPQDLAETLGRRDAAARLRLVTRTWNPAALIGAGDTRDLGVMLDRIEIR